MGPFANIDVNQANNPFRSYKAAKAEAEANQRLGQTLNSAEALTGSPVTQEVLTEAMQRQQNGLTPMQTAYRTGQSLQDQKQATLTELPQIVNRYKSEKEKVVKEFNALNNSGNVSEQAFRRRFELALQYESLNKEMNVDVLSTLLGVQQIDESQQAAREKSMDFMKQAGSYYANMEIKPVKVRPPSSDNGIDYESSE
jgi:hypothetical protein